MTYTDEDDLYSGYAATGEVGWRPSSRAQPGIGAPPTRAAMGTAMAGGDGAPRPMTAMKAAGYSSGARPVTGAVGGFNPGGVGSAAPPLKSKEQANPEEACKELERQVHKLLEESAAASVAGDAAGALEKAKEAGKRERLLTKKREEEKLEDAVNKELTFAVVFNVAAQYHKSRMYAEALNAYGLVVKNKALGHAGLVRVNMGNVHFEQKKYPTAIKMYRMALDQLPEASKELRFRILRNIGNAFVRMGQYQDAVSAYESVMENFPEAQTGFNLVVCQYYIGDKEGMKRAFDRLLATHARGEGGGTDGADEDAEAEEAFDAVPDHIVQDDGLREELRRRRAQTARQIAKAGRLIALKLDPAGFEAGFDWVIGELARFKFTPIRNELEMAKALTYLNQRNFDKATELLKSFERKDRELKATAATNLSFLNFLEGALGDAEAHANLAMQADRYNAAPLVNRGNCFYARGDYESAKTAYLEAVGVEPDCVEALYNLGLTNTRLGAYDDALHAFKKLHKMMPDSAEVVFQIGNVYDRKGGEAAAANAVHWFELLNSRVMHMHDPGVLARLGAVYAKEDDEAKALHYFTEAHRVYPVNLDVITWLGAFYVRNEVYEKAVPFFERAARLQPQEVKWRLMVASCHRRLDRLPQAYDRYREIHREHPENVECLRYLKQICTELEKQEESAEYAAKLRRAEKAQQGAAATGATGAAGVPYGGGEGGGRGGGMDRDAGGYGGGGGMLPLGDVDGALDLGFGGPPPKPAARKPPPPKAAPADVDEWGNGELGEDLLPM